MKCGACGHGSSTVSESRPLHESGNNCIRRRRECASCGFRWSTREMPLPDQPMILTPEGALLAIDVEAVAAVMHSALMKGLGLG